LLFDPNPAGNITPQSDDRRFTVTSGNSSNLAAYKGDGAGWVVCGGDCGGAEEGYGRLNGSKEVYEFKIRYSDIWGTDTPSPNAVAGFAIIAHDQATATNFAWGADGVIESNPNTWGFIQIPEFHEILIPVVGSLLVVMVFARRRRLDG